MGGNHGNTSHSNTSTSVPGWAATVDQYSRALGFGVKTPQSGGKKKIKSKKISRKAGKKSRRRRKKKMFGMNIF